MKRRTFLKNTTISTAGSVLSPINLKADNAAIEVLNPYNRVPVNFIIDDSTALVNLAYYGIPQFAEVFPDNYKQDWKNLPREIPDSFVLEFLEWCDQNGVKGKYSMVPYPACTGWLHRFIPGWSRKELNDSLKIVRELAQPNWDIHSEMISHTRVIDIKTGVPYPEASPDYMENWEWSQERSADELGEYIAYSLQILEEAGFHCDGVTTPGGFGSRNIPNLAKGTQYAVREVFGESVAHFFRDVITEPGKSVQPQVMHPTGLQGSDPSCSVHMIACTGDWFGGWDGLTPGDADKFITADLEGGRLPEVIESEEPAIFICHWPGIYYNGEKLGFNIFKTVVNRLHERYDNLRWMKLTEIAHYWAAREHTVAKVTINEVSLSAPFSTSGFTIKLPFVMENPELESNGKSLQLRKVKDELSFEDGTYYMEGNSTTICLKLHKGQSYLRSQV